MKQYGNYMSKENHQKFINKESRNMEIRRKEAMLKMSIDHGYATAEEIKQMESHIEELKMSTWLS